MMRVPEAMLPVFDTVAPILDDFCHALLDERYASKCREALAKLCRMRPSPLLGGKMRSWAAGICYFICEQNDRLVVSCKSRIPADEIAAFFGLKACTAAAKAAHIRKLFHAQSFNERYWDFHSRSNPWIVQR